MFFVCEQLGIEMFVQIVVCQEVEGKVVGGVCCYVGWVLEDCYKFSIKMLKVVIYVGWCDMDIYMCENKIDIVLIQEMLECVEEKVSQDKYVMELVDVGVDSIEKLVDEKFVGKMFGKQF